ncbi:MAG: transcription elongation factor GreA [Mycoplasmataceae bacterium]|nr:transcription elongation factor GreA [Mycoplasmataceae bacterium]
MELEKNLLTKEGKKELNVELKNLIDVERPQVIADIKEARERGDLSENAEFDAARDKQGQIEGRINEIKAILENSKVVTKVKSSKVRVGSTVKIQNMKTNKTMEYAIVGSLEADPMAGKISNESPVAVAILGQEKGATVQVQVAKKYKIKIVEIK